jgi:Protein of unknown function (DUF1573)
MKYTVAVIGLLLTMVAQAQTGTAAIKFHIKEYNFKTVIEGQNVTYGFVFKNTGTADLVITGAESSCDCMVASLPEKPVKPNEWGKVMVVFYTEGMANENRKSSKSVTITTNTTPAVTSLYMMGFVKPKK